MKTYGKQMRKVPAWLSPENHRQAFDSTLSTDGEVSVFEPSKPTKIRYVEVERSPILLAVILPTNVMCYFFISPLPLMLYCILLQLMVCIL